jgi:hypothetical protein
MAIAEVINQTEWLAGNSCGYGDTLFQPSIGLNFNRPNAIPFARLGIDDPCGAPWDYYRNLILFHSESVLTQLSAVELAAWTAGTLVYPPGSVTVKFYRLSGTQACNPEDEQHQAGSGSIIADWVQAGIVSVGNVASFTAAMATGPALWTSPVFLTPGDVPNGGYVTVDVTTPFNLAIAQADIAGSQLGRGRVFGLRLRLVSESQGSYPFDPHLYGLNWYAIAGFQAAGFQPVLSIGAGTTPAINAQTVLFDRAAVRMRLIVLIPCVENPVPLDHLRTQADWQHSHGVTMLRQGNTVHLEASLVDNYEVPARFINAALYVTVTAADGTVVVNALPMTRTALGIYFLDYHTTAADPLGLYTVEFTATLV